MTDSQLRDLLELGAQTETPAELPDDFFDRATGRRRQTRLRRTGASLGVAAVVALGATTISSGGLPFTDTRPAGPVTASWADAPQCVRDVLARTNHRVQQDGLAVVVVDLPSTKSEITQGISAGTGWRGIEVVDVVVDQPGVTPADGFVMWDGVTPDEDPAPGRNLMAVTLDRSPKVPADAVGEPTWLFDGTGHFPIAGDLMTVTCADGPSAAIPWRDSADTWLAPDAPRQAPSTEVPSGAATPWPPTAATDLPTTVP